MSTEFLEGSLSHLLESNLFSVLFILGIPEYDYSKQLCLPLEMSF